MARIQVWTKLHSIGSQRGSSSVRQASIKRITTNPLKYKKPKLKDMFIKSLSQVKKEYLKLWKSYEVKSVTLVNADVGKSLEVPKELESGLLVNWFVIEFSLKACALFEFLE